MAKESYESRKNKLIKRCNYLMDFYGSKQTFIADSIGVTRTSMYLFLKGEREFGDETLNKLKEFLDLRVPKNINKFINK